MSSGNFQPPLVRPIPDSPPCKYVCYKVWRPISSQHRNKSKIAARNLRRNPFWTTYLDFMKNIKNPLATKLESNCLGLFMNFAIYAFWLASVEPKCKQMRWLVQNEIHPCFYSVVWLCSVVVQWNKANMAVNFKIYQPQIVVDNLVGYVKTEQDRNSILQLYCKTYGTA